MLTKSSAARFLSNSAQKARKKVDCAVYGCGLSASGALAIPKLIQGTSNSDDVTSSEVEYPKRVTYFNTKSIKFVSSGFGFSLFASENKLYGAGINNRFQIGGQLTDASKYQDYYISAKKINIPAEEILEISSGRAHSLIRTSSGVFAIGDNNFGQCGRDPTTVEYVVGSEESPLLPLELPNPIVSIHCSLDTSFLVDSTGQVYSFGLNEDGQCGNEKYGIQWQPQLVKGDVESVQIEKVRGSTDTIMATSRDGEVFVWGQTEYRQAVDATTEIQLNTSLHLNLSSSIGPISSIDTTQSSVIAQNRSGEVFVWGVGVLGMGPDAEVLKRPVQMDQPLFDGKKISSISAGNSCMSAINESGRLFIWGENRFSSLGLGHSKRQLFPYQLFLPGDVKAAALGPDHSLFLVN